MYCFVYGTLRRDDANDINGLTPKPRLVGFATVHGRLFDFGSYPGLVLASAAEGGTPVLGEVYEIEPALVPKLDEIEEVYPGRAALYAQRKVLLSCGGRQLECMLYELTDGGASAQAQLAADGSLFLDWRSFDLQRKALA